jgi:hypothetical protein
MSTTITKNGIAPLDTRKPCNDEVVALRQALQKAQRKIDELIECVGEQDELIAHLKGQAENQDAQAQHAQEDPDASDASEEGVPVGEPTRAADRRAVAASQCATAAERRASTAACDGGPAFPLVTFRGVGGRKSQRTKGLPKVDKAVALTTEGSDFGTVPFLAHFGIKTPQQLQYKLADFMIASLGLADPDQQRKHRNQAKFKADNFLRLLWFDAPKTSYDAGNADQLFEYFLNTYHADMGTDAAFFNHDHRIAKWFWPSQVHNYASFKRTDNAYIARQSRAFMTGVRAVHNLYRVFKGAQWPVGPATLPVLASGKSAKRSESRPATPKPKRQRAIRAEASEAEASASSGDESDEGHWSAHSNGSSDGGGNIDTDDELEASWLAFHQARGR